MLSWSTSDVVGVNFGDSHITVARLRGNNSGPFEVTHAGWESYDPSAPEREIALAVKALWRKAGLPTKTVVASLRSSALVVRYFKYPSMPGSELRSALQLQAEECLQLTRDELVVDCHINKGEVLREGNRVEGEMIEGVLAAAPSKDVDHVLNILHMAGLDPIVLDVRAVAVANLYATLAAKREDSTVCVVNLSPHSADVIVLSKSGAMYPHTVFCRASTWAESPAFLCENIRDVMKYSEFKLDWEPVHRVFLTGDMPIQGVTVGQLGNGDFLSNVQTGLKLPVETWNPLKHLVLKTKGIRELIEGHPADAARLAPSLGLALRRG
ncbi:MAG: pilus assembly protein PilM [bacterium]